jgi:pSer/pThr/pTyr-binding forkhead associated (FHA) protein
MMMPSEGINTNLQMAVMARVAGWAIAGMAIGTAVGAAKGSKNLAVQGMIGGAIGGGIGGLFFDLLSGVGSMTDIMNTTRYHYATSGRLFAGTLTGIFIGAAVAMIQEYSKQAWITVLAGKNEGRDYILCKPNTSIGRDELADIPLYGDKTVEKKHASIEEHMGVHVLSAAGPVTVNNQPVNNAQLRNGDFISIGRHTLKFTTRSVEAFSSWTPGPSPSQPQPYAQTQAYQPVVYPAGTQVAPKLRAVGGMLAGTVFEIQSYQVSIGRDPSNIISLVQDTSVSRRHAEIIYDNGQYILRDTGSTNGVYVNGIKVSEASITPADVIQIGATQFRLVFEPPLS